jgi:two-component system, sensor histidine kinase and response regulator
VIYDVAPLRSGDLVADRQESEARILAVDDTPANLIALRALLEPLGHGIVTAESGHEALACAAESEFALVLLDVMMPEMDGFETLEHLRALPSFGGTPVLLVSAYEPPAQAMERAYAMGAFDYVLKPIAPAVLQAKVAVYTSLYRRGVELRRRGAALAAKDRQIAMLAHDLRSPLTAIRMIAESQVRSEPSERSRELSRRVLRAADRMEAMTEELLDFARAGSTGMPVTPVEVDLGALCRESVEEVTAGHPDRSIDVEIAGTVEGKWDRERIRQAFSNLLVNAVKYGRGRIAVRVRLSSGYAESQIWNDGDPIPEDRMARIFEPFERGAQGGAGLGLGLYIVREIARSHGGGVRVESAHGRGTTFTLRLPLQAAVDPQPAPRAGA